MKWLDDLLRKSEWIDMMYTQGNEWVPYVMYASVFTILVGLIAVWRRSRGLAIVTFVLIAATCFVGHKGRQQDLGPAAEMREAMDMTQGWAAERVELMEEMAFHPMRAALIGAVGGGALGLCALFLGYRKHKTVEV